MLKADLHDRQPSQPPYLCILAVYKLIFVHRAQKYKQLRLLFTKVKAHENSVKQYIDFGVILLQERSNKRSPWPEMNQASPCQIDVQQRNNKHWCENLLVCVFDNCFGGACFIGE